MRWLKLFTTTAFVFGVVLLIAWPWVLGPQPDAEATSRKVVAEWGLRALIYFFVTCISFLSAALGSWLIMRRARREFTDIKLKAVEELVEGSLRDHSKQRPKDTTNE